MGLTRPRLHTKNDDSYSTGEKCDWVAMSMSAAAISAYTVEYWWASHWFAFG